MKTIKVGAWYEKLTQKKRLIFRQRLNVSSVLRSYFTTRLENNLILKVTMSSAIRFTLTHITALSITIV